MNGIKRHDVKMMDSDATRLRSLSRRGFAIGGLAALGVAGGLRWLAGQTDGGGIPWPLRRILEFNEKLWRTSFRDDRLAETFPRQDAVEPRVNGTHGLPAGLGDVPNPQEVSNWRIEVSSPRGVASVSMADLQKLPRIEMTTELRCIEGWSAPVHWSGFRFLDFAALVANATRSGDPPRPGDGVSDLYDYVQLATQDEAYFVGLDAPSAFHPQTLLVDRMNGKPLTIGHGGPLRLVIPVKYGVKNIKRLSIVKFTDERPGDFWADRGYDWYAGL